MAMLSTRRALLGAIAAVPVASMIAVPSCATPVAAHDPDEVELAIEKFNAADAAWIAFDEAIQEPIRRYADAVDAIPHSRTTASYHAVANPEMTLSTADGHSVAMARKIVADADKGLLYNRSTRPEDGAFIAVQRELAALADKRDAERAQLRKSYRIDAWRRLEDRYVSKINAASDAVVAAPAATLAALARKIDFLDRTESWESGGSEAVARDVRRLAAEGR